ncbi:MAG: DEAD/DEAH box helicase family protein [Bacteroidota bacterium]
MASTLTERDVCTKLITPALVGAGWDVQRQIREEVTFTDGRIIHKGKLHKRGKQRRADYVLSIKPNVPLAVIEAKDLSHSVGAGMPQALAYAEALDVPFAYSSNGRGFIEHDRTGQGETIERELTLEAFPSPDELWQRYRRWKGLDERAAEVVLQDYYTEAGGKEPRYYQRIAINRVVEAFATGQERMLLVMATGTGKTYAAFQIIWRLWKAKQAQRVLFLADRNILVDQAMQNDFRPFGGAMVKVQNRTADKAYEIYLALYQAVSGTDERQNIYREFSPDFFDLIVVDECHRGSASADSAWREILNYFAPAAKLGLTATLKETADVSTSHYFGDALYTYSLKQGIEDGFLAPYHVIRLSLDRDLEGWRPEAGTTDRYGREIEDREYGQKDFDKTLVLPERRKAVAQRIAEFLETNDPYAKTIVFCVDIEHAEAMRRELVNACADRVREDARYVVRITGDSDDGVRQLDPFIDPESWYPVIATTSQMLTTGVDAQTCKLIVLDRSIGSMTEFKQIIGRGTRLREDYGKVGFTILDTRRNTNKFSDPEFDGDPVRVFEVVPGEPVPSTDTMEPDEADPDDPTASGPDRDWVVTGQDPGPRKLYADGVEVRKVNERYMVYGADGRLITESLRDFTRSKVHERFASLDDFLTRWREADRKAAVVEEMEEQGLPLDALREEIARERGADAASMDPFDLVAHVAFDRPPVTRSERARTARRSDVFDRYEAPAREVLAALLDKYADEGIEDLEAMDVLRVQPLNRFGTPLEIVRRFGGKDGYHRAVQDLTRALYRAA